MLIVREMQRSPSLNMEVVGFVDDNPRLKGMFVGGALSAATNRTVYVSVTDGKGNAVTDLFDVPYLNCFNLWLVAFDLFDERLKYVIGDFGHCRLPTCMDELWVRGARAGTVCSN